MLMDREWNTRCPPYTVFYFLRKHQKSAFFKKLQTAQKDVEDNY